MPWLARWREVREQAALPHRQQVMVLSVMASAGLKTRSALVKICLGAGLFFLFHGEGLGHGGQGGRRGLFGLHRLLGLRIDAAFDGHIEKFCLLVLLHDEFDGLIAIFVENSIKNIFVFQSHKVPPFIHMPEVNVYEQYLYGKR